MPFLFGVQVWEHIWIWLNFLILHWVKLFSDCHLFRLGVDEFPHKNCSRFWSSKTRWMIFKTHFKKPCKGFEHLTVFEPCLLDFKPLIKKHVATMGWVLLVKLQTHFEPRVELSCLSWISKNGSRFWNSRTWWVRLRMALRFAVNNPFYSKQNSHFEYCRSIAPSKIWELRRERFWPCPP